MPIDVSYPIPLLEDIVTDSQPTAVIVEPAMKQYLPNSKNDLFMFQRWCFNHCLNKYMYILQKPPEAKFGVILGEIAGKIWLTIASQIAGVIAGTIFIAGQIAPAIMPKITADFAPGGFPNILIAESLKSQLLQIQFEFLPIFWIYMSIVLSMESCNYGLHQEMYLQNIMTCNKSTVPGYLRTV